MRLVASSALLGALPAAAHAAPVTLALETAVAAPVDGATVAVRPDIWWALDERVTLGVTSSGAARGRLLATHGLCVRGCADVVGGGAIEARFALGSSPLIGAIALHARQLAPTPLAVELGVQRRWRSGRITAATAPRLELGITRRDLANGEFVHVPLTLSVTIADGIAAGLSSGMRGELSGDFFDTATLPSYVAVTYAAAKWQLDLRVGTDDARAARPVPTVTLGVAVALAAAPPHARLLQ